MEAQSYILLTLALLLAALGAATLGVVKRRRDAEAVGQRMAALGEGPGLVRRRGFVERLFLRAGLAEERGIAWLLAGLWLLAGFVGLVVAGWAGLLAGFGLGVVGVYLAIEWQGRRRSRQLVAQLPGFVEHIGRSLQAGRTLTAAMQAATDEARPPLREVMQRAEREVRLGAGLADALQGVADLYRLEALRLVALGVRFNLRYGGSARELMEQVVAVLRRRERARRQLRAMTGETRISAVVLAVLPVAIALYTVVMNPDYYATILDMPEGPWLLAGAGAWQLLGVFVLWRMMRAL